MGMAASLVILVMWLRSFEQTFVPPSQGGSTWKDFYDKGVYFT